MGSKWLVLNMEPDPLKKSEPLSNEIVQDILKTIEVLLIVADGRPLLQALQFGGVTKLSRRVSQFLKRGAIHRDKFGDESCIPFLVSRFNKSNRHLIRHNYDSQNDVIEWIAERYIPDSTVCMSKNDHPYIL